MAGESIITIGNFDGVHLGHRAILEAARSLSGSSTLAVKALTFDPHPASVLRPGTEPARLMSLDQKVAALRACGADEVVVLEPTPGLLALGPADFLRWVVDQHHPRVVVEGSGFRFGRGRSGDIGALSEVGSGLGFEVRVVGQVEAALHDQLLVAVSSSVIRWLVLQGRVADAMRCLGRPHVLWGKVEGGRKRGRAMGVATANLDGVGLAGYAVPGEGVYGGWAVLEGGERYLAAISVGRQATFGEGGLRVEAHLLDFEGDLYNQRVGIEWVRWIRSQEAFPSQDDLKRRIVRDIELIQEWHAMGLLSDGSAGGCAWPAHAAS